MKLAEINFKLSEFSKSEELVDLILARSKAPSADQTCRVFANKMKAFFCSIKGDQDAKLFYLSEAGKFTGEQNATFDDLDLIKNFFMRIEYNFMKNGR